MDVTLEKLNKPQEFVVANMLHILGREDVINEL